MCQPQDKDETISWMCCALLSGERLKPPPGLRLDAALRHQEFERLTLLLRPQGQLTSTSYETTPPRQCTLPLLPGIQLHAAMADFLAVVAPSLLFSNLCSPPRLCP